MIEVAVIVKVEKPPMALVQQIAHITGLSVGAVQRSLVAGKMLVRVSLVSNDWEEHAAMLRRLVPVLTDAGVAADAYDLDERADVSDDARCELADVLAGIDEMYEQRQRSKALREVGHR